MSSRSVALLRTASFLALLLAVASPASAGPDGPLDPTEIGFRIGYGEAPSKPIRYLPISLRAGFDVPDWVPEIAGNRIRWIVEAGGMVIDDDVSDETAYELDLSPLIFDLRLDWGQRVVPFFNAGEGILYTSVSRRLNLGQSVLFSSQFGGGVHLFFGDRDAITIAGRYRHISNAGFSRPNSGLNQWFVTLSLTRFPHRDR